MAKADDLNPMPESKYVLYADKDGHLSAFYIDGQLKAEGDWWQVYLQMLQTLGVEYRDEEDGHESFIIGAGKEVRAAQTLTELREYHAKRKQLLAESEDLRRQSEELARQATAVQ